MYSFKAQVPSNIAIVKYWGKFGRQFPCNPSLSFTLDKCHTLIDFSFEESGQFTLDFDFSESTTNSFSSSNFKKRIEDNIKLYIDEFNAPTGHYKISTENTFPHSSGIASSASAFASIALAVESITSKIESREANFERASALARLASGSASRSVYGGYVSWGEEEVLGGSNEYAVKLDNIHENFKGIKDAVLIVDPSKKAVSSTQGHQLMNSHFYRETRFEQARENHRLLINSLKTGDWDLFIEIAENEALSLHALMMTSHPSFILLKPNSLAIIEEIRKYRSTTGKRLCFTIDAGPNIHLLYNNNESVEIEAFIAEKLEPLCQQTIFDQIGDGPKIL